MRGTDETSGSLFSYVGLEDRIPTRHPRRRIRQVVNDALASLNADFKALYVPFSRPSITPERLIQASLLQIPFSIRSERHLMEQMNYNLLFRWFVGLGIDDAVWVPTVFTKNRDRLLSTERSRKIARSEHALRCETYHRRKEEAEARTAGWELVGPSQDRGPNYRRYRHGCGHER